MRTIVVIPCLDEEKTVADVVSKASRFADMCIVADDNSKDGTVKVARSVGAYVVGHNGAKGAGVNTKVGIKTALVFGADVVVTLDGDGQHNPEELSHVVKPITDGEADVVVGSRFLNAHSLPRYRKFGIDVITWLYNVGCKNKISDGQSCFRAYSREALKVIMPMRENGFSFSVETLIKARSTGCRITEVPISCVYHKDYKQNSSLNPMVHGLSVVWGVVRWRMKIEMMSKIRRLIGKKDCK